MSLIGLNSEVNGTDVRPVLGGEGNKYARACPDPAGPSTMSPDFINTIIDDYKALYARAARTPQAGRVADFPDGITDIAGIREPTLSRAKNAVTLGIYENGRIIRTDAHSTPGDGGGMMFEVVPENTAGTHPESARLKPLEFKVKPRQFGGTDRTAVQRALDFSAATRAVVEFQSEVHEVDGTVTAASNTRIDAVPGAILRAVNPPKADPGDPVPPFNGNKLLELAGGADNITIDRLTIDANDKVLFALFGQANAGVYSDDLEIINWNYGFVLYSSTGKATRDVHVKRPRIHTPRLSSNATYGFWLKSTKGELPLDTVSVEFPDLEGTEGAAHPDNPGSTGDILTFHGVHNFVVRGLRSRHSGELGATFSRWCKNGRIIAPDVSGADLGGIAIGSGAADFVLTSAAGIKAAQAEILNVTRGETTILTLDSIADFPVGYKGRINGIVAGSTQELNAQTITVHAHVGGNDVEIWDGNDSAPINSTGFTAWTAPNANGNTRIERVIFQSRGTGPLEHTSVVIGETGDNTIYGELVRGDLDVGPATDGVTNVVIEEARRTENVCIVDPNIRNNNINRLNQTTRDGDPVQPTGAALQQSVNCGVLGNGVITGHEIGISTPGSDSYTIDPGIDLRGNTDPIGFFGTGKPRMAYDNVGGFMFLAGSRGAALGLPVGAATDRWRSVLIRERSGTLVEMSTYQTPVLELIRAGNGGEVLQFTFGDHENKIKQARGFIGMFTAADTPIYLSGTLRPGVFNVIAFADLTNAANAAAANAVDGMPFYCADHPLGAAWVWKTGDHTVAANWHHPRDIRRITVAQRNAGVFKDGSQIIVTDGADAGLQFREGGVWNRVTTTVAA